MARDIQKVTHLNEVLEFNVNKITKEQETLKQQCSEYVEQQGEKMKITQDIKAQIEELKLQQQISSDELTTINNHIIISQQEFRKLDNQWKAQAEQDRIAREA